MGGCSVDGEWEFASVTGVRTLVLVGRTGNGKSATGNSILRKEAFVSKPSSGGVTSTCMLKSTVLEDDLTLNVIDTPGLSDYSDEPEFVGKEIVRCIDTAKDGIHAVLVVLSTSSRFSREEDAIMSLQKFFGPKITAYIVVVFTGGDSLEVNRLTLDEYLGPKRPKPLKELLSECGNRRVLFDNQSKDEDKRAKQLKELLLLVDEVLRINDGYPFTDEIFAELKKAEEKLCDQSLKVDSLQGHSNQEYYELMNRITKMVEEKLKEAILKLEHQLAKERAARLKAEEYAEKAQKKSADEVRILKEDLEKAEKAAAKKGICPIL